MLKYTDSHCHLSQTENFSEIFARAQHAGITNCVLNAVTESEWGQVAQISRDNKNVCGCIGIHPFYVETAGPAWDTDLISILNDNPNLMIGEVGLDKTRDNFATQERIFIRALEIAIAHHRTINIHCVHAWDIMLNILKSYGDTLPTIVAHAFDGTENVLNFNADIYFSYSPNVANPNYKRVAASVARVPKNKILVESDSTTLLPTTTAANGVLALRDDISPNDIYNNAMGVFFK